MNDTWSSKSIFFCTIAHIFGMFSELSLPSSCRQHTLTRITAFRDQRKNTPILFLLQAECSQMFSPIRVKPMRHRKDYAPVVQLDLQ